MSTSRVSAPAAERGGSFESSLVRQLLVLLVIVKVAGLVLVFDPYSLQSFDLPKTFYSRATEWLIAAAIVVALLRYGPAIVPRTWMHVPLAAFVGANVVSTLLAENQYIAVFGEWDRYEGLAFIVDMAVLYLAVAIAFRRDDWRAFLAALGLATLLVLGYALVQYLDLDPVAWEQSGIRPPGTFGQADSLGQYLSVVFGALIGLISWRSSLAIGARLAVYSILLLTIVVAGVAATRGTFAAMLAVLVVAPFAAMLASSGWARRLSAALIGTAALITLTVTLWAATPLGERMTFSALNDVLDHRRLAYDSALRASIDKPVFGHGPDSFRVIYGRYRQPERAAILGVANSENSVHNWILQTSVTSGLAGLLSLCSALVLFAASLVPRLRRPREALPAVLLTSAVGYWINGLVSPHSIGVDWFPWVSFGAVAAMQGGAHVSARSRSLWLNGFGAAAVILASLGVLTARGAVISARSAWEATAQLTQPEMALVAARVATAEDPGRPQYWEVLARAFAANQDWSDAADAYAEAGKRAPYEWTHWANRAEMLVNQADNAKALDDAVNSAMRGVEVDPNEPAAQASAANVALKAGANDVALRSALAAFVLFPQGSYDRLAQRAATAPQARPEAARASVESALSTKNSAYLHLALAALEFQLNREAAGRLEVQRARELGATPAEADALLRAMGR